MKIILKNLKQAHYTVEIPDDNATVGDLKEKVEQQYGFDSTTLKLIFNGCVLDNTKTLESYKIHNKSVIIMMNSKIKPINIPKEDPKPKELPKSEEPSNPKPKKQKPPPKDYSKEVSSLMEMGFGKEESETAIKAAKGNIQFAIEFLYNGIPSIAEGDGEKMEIDESEGDSVKNIASVVKVFMAQDPSSFEQIMTILSQINPEMLEMIKENEENFKNYLLQPVTEEDMRIYQEFCRHFGLGEEEEGEEGEQEMLGHSGNWGGLINLTREEFEAVKRLKEMGNFSEAEIVQVYLACDKNEEMAANLLFETKMSEGNIQYTENPPQNQQQQEEKKEEEKKEKDGKKEEEEK